MIDTAVKSMVDFSMDSRFVPVKGQQLFSQIHVFLKPGELLGEPSEGGFYARAWHMARADSFDPAENDPTSNDFESEPDTAELTPS
ncbi:hypothetical protein [uncultured Microbulbifer sp.]|uniref:hypothetical protein n=1 Tax=uncultured Microbulbifer sp. TaxID=348147 RepID=UPI0026333D43|nr:hypothetical protein [uncultured Microbulbifer sp.]